MKQNIDFTGMSKDEKIELIQGLTSGTLRIIGEKVVNIGPTAGMVITMHLGRFYAGCDLTAELPPDFFDSYEGSAVFMPFNERINDSKSNINQN